MAEDDKQHESPVLAARDVTFGYTPDSTVLRSVSCELRPGRLTALIGPNAGGKSTLLNLLLGQLQPTQGSIQLLGDEVSQMHPPSRAALMSYVPQRGQVSFAFTVRQIVKMGRHALATSENAVDSAIEQADLQSLADRVYHELSVGQQQRVVLARAIAQSIDQGAVMLLDEPVSAMDLWHVHHTIANLRRLADEGLAVLVVLHDLNLAAQYADDVWLLSCGEIASQGPWQDILKPEILEPIYRVKLTTMQPADADRPVLVVRGSDTMRSR